MTPAWHEEVYLDNKFKKVSTKDNFSAIEAILAPKSVYIVDLLMMAKTFRLMGFPLFLAEASAPLNAILSIDHSVFVKGDQTNFEIEPSFGVEASELYPDVK